MFFLDIIWSVGFGASFAAAATKQLSQERFPLVNRYFLYNLLFLSLLFVPSAIYLMWAFPAWKTMFLISDLHVPAFMPALLAFTSVFVGILGFWLAYHFIRSNNEACIYFHARSHNWNYTHTLLWGLLVSEKDFSIQSEYLLSRALWVGCHVANTDDKKEYAHYLWTASYVTLFGAMGFGHERLLYVGDYHDWHMGREYAAYSSNSYETREGVRERERQRGRMWECGRYFLTVGTLIRNKCGT